MVCLVKGALRLVFFKPKRAQRETWGRRRCIESGSEESSRGWIREGSSSFLTSGLVSFAFWEQGTVYAACDHLLTLAVTLKATLWVEE